MAGHRQGLCWKIHFRSSLKIGRSGKPANDQPRRAPPPPRRALLLDAVDAAGGADACKALRACRTEAPDTYCGTSRECSGTSDLLEHRAARGENRARAEPSRAASFERQCLMWKSHHDLLMLSDPWILLESCTAAAGGPVRGQKQSRQPSAPMVARHATQAAGPPAHAPAHVTSAAPHLKMSHPDGWIAERAVPARTCLPIAGA
jgi:hypothetical protein